MIRSRRVLAALLLSSPVAAQVARLPVVAPYSAAPAIVAPAVFGAALLAPAALAPTPSFSALSPLAAAPLAAPLAAAPAFAAPAAALAAAPAFAVAPSAAAGIAASAEAAPALPALAAAAADPRRPLLSPAAAQPAVTLDAGRGLFDGSRELRTRSGSVFAPSFAKEYEEFPGGFALVRQQPSPVAPRKTVGNAQGLYGAPLLARVGDIAARGQRETGYHAASKQLFSVADNHTLNNLPGVADAYSGAFIPGTSAEARDYEQTGDKSHDGWSRHQTMNVEHVFPQSLFGGVVPMRSDLHILMATLEHPNGMRGSLPFGVVKGKPDYRNSAGAKRGGGVFEPPDFTKGRVARAMLYFYARYSREDFFGRRSTRRFWNAQIETMLDWNRRFPPTVEERRRNDHVERFQGNRNPFVDDPKIADKIGLDAWLAPMPRDANRYAAVDASDTLNAGGRRSDVPRKGNQRQAMRRANSARRGPRR